MAKPRAKHWQFLMPLYGIRVLLIRATPEAYIRLLGQYCADITDADRPHGEGETRFLVHPQRPPMIVIWLDACADLRQPYWIGTLAHECWHGVWRAAREIGLNRNIESEPSGEAHAYLHGWLMAECLTRLQRRSTPKRAGRRKK